MSKTIDLDAAIATIMSEPSEVRYPAYYAEKLKRLPAVPHEMTAREFLRDFHRLCQSMGCDECPITHDNEPRTCAVLMGCFPDETIETVAQWAAEHPEERSEDDA